MSKHHPDTELELDRELRPFLYPFRRPSGRYRSPSPRRYERSRSPRYKHERRSSISSRVSWEDISEGMSSRRIPSPRSPLRRGSISITRDNNHGTSIKQEESPDKGRLSPRDIPRVEPLAPFEPIKPAPLTTSQPSLTDPPNPPPVPDSTSPPTKDVSIASTPTTSPKTASIQFEPAKESRTSTEPSESMPQQDKRATWGKRIAIMANVLEMRIERKKLDRELSDLRALQNASSVLGASERQLLEQRHNEVQTKIDNSDKELQDHFSQLSVNDFWDRGAEKAVYDDLAKTLAQLEEDHQKAMKEVKQIKPTETQDSNAMNLDPPVKSKYTEEELDARAQQLEAIEKQLEELWDQVQGELGQYQNDLIAREDSLGDEIDAKIEEYFAQDGQETLLGPLYNELQNLRDQQMQLKETTEDQEKLVLELSDDIEQQWEQIKLLNFNQSQLKTRIEQCMAQRENNRYHLQALEAAMAAHEQAAAAARRSSPQHPSVSVVGADVLELVRGAAQELVRQEMEKAFIDARAGLENVLNEHRTLVNNTLMTKVVATMQAVDEISRAV